MGKGILALGGLAALLTVPIAASGEPPAATQRGDDYEIRMTLRTFNGEPTELRRFRFKKLDAICDGGAIIEVRGRLRSIPVNNRNRFRAVLRRGSKTVRVRGKVSGDLERVRGKIRVRGDFGSAQNCDSGRIRWGPERVGPRAQP